MEVDPQDVIQSLLAQIASLSVDLAVQKALVIKLQAEAPQEGTQG